MGEQASVGAILDVLWQRMDGMGVEWGLVAVPRGRM